MHALHSLNRSHLPVVVGIWYLNLCERGHVGKRDRGDVADSRLWITRRARPTCASGDAGQLDRRFLKRRRREQRSVVVLFQHGQRLLAQLRREVDDVILRDSLPIKWSGLGREGLRWGASLSGHRRLGNGSLFDGPNRIARHTVKHVAKTLLAHLGDSL